MAAPNIVLIGFMGAGKSSVGREVARRARMHFRDTDFLVRARVGASIPEIFEAEGEAFFRAQESAVLQELAGVRGIVLATGGGILLTAANGPLLRALGPVVWLTADEDTIWQRVNRNQNRPLLRTDAPRQTLRELLKVRLPMYAGIADVRIDSTGRGHGAVAGQILEAVRGWGDREHQSRTDVPGEDPRV